MANTLGFYNPQFYANEALIQLENALGLARTIHRGYEGERNTFGKGDTINIRRPSTFTVYSAPKSSGIDDLAPESVTITLNQWKEVAFLLTDKELAFTQQRIIDEHIRPQAVALANDIDVFLAAFYQKVPWQIDTSDPMQAGDITTARKQLFINKAPINDAVNMWGMVGAVEEKELLDIAAFSQHQGAGPEGVATQITGGLGRKYGFNIFANQNTPTHAVGTAIAGDPAFIIKAGETPAHGDTTLQLDDMTDSETLKPGDILSIAGITQKYAVTALATSSSTEALVSISPALRGDDLPSASDVVTVSGQASIGENLFYHRNWASLVVAPLPTALPNELGAKVATATDPITGLSLRSRLFYVGLDSEVHVAMDVLYGGVVLDPNLCVRMSNAT